MPKQYPKEVRDRAVRLVLEHRGDYDTEYGAIRSIGARCGVGAETLRKWLRQAEVDAGQRPGVTSEESAEIRRLKRENAELRRANEILKAASAFFAAELCATRRRDDRVEVRDLRRRAVAAA
jgi:transposase